jgi:hypothetical protein
MEICKATITLPDDSKVTFEGPADFVDRQVEKYTSKRPSEETPGHSTMPKEHRTEGSPEKQLVSQKRPRGHHEIATVLAFAITEAGMTEFSEDDLRRAYIRAEVRPPKYVSQALRDAKSKFDYITTGTKRGTYKLTNHGDRTVRFDLPRLDR